MTKDFFRNGEIRNGARSNLEANLKNENIPLNPFSEIGSFLKNQNNYYGHFRPGMWGEMKRTKGYYIAFKNNYPELEKRLIERIEQITKLSEIEKEPIISDLFLAYNLMVNMINTNPCLIDSLFIQEKRIDIDPYLLTR